MAIAQEAGDESTTARAFRALGTLALRQKDNLAGRALLTQALELFRHVDEQWGIGGTLSNLGIIAQNEGDLAGAQALYLESLTILKQLGAKYPLGFPLRQLGLLAVLRGDYERAGVFMRESLSLNIDVGDKRGIAACLVAVASLYAARGRLADAARLCGAAEALLDAIHTQIFPYDQEQNERNLAALCAQLGPAAFEAALAAGRLLTLEQAIALALVEPLSADQ